MKMFKKLMAVVLTGALAVSMLTGCAITDKIVGNSAKKALETLCSAGGKDATFTEITSTSSETNKAYKTASQAVEKALKEAIKADKDAKTYTLPSELLDSNAAVQAAIAANPGFTFVVAKYDTSKDTVQKSISDAQQAKLKATVPAGEKGKFYMGNEIKGVKDAGKEKTCSWVLITVKHA